MSFKLVIDKIACCLMLIRASNHRPEHTHAHELDHSKIRSICYPDFRHVVICGLPSDRCPKSENGEDRCSHHRTTFLLPRRCFTRFSYYTVPPQQNTPHMKHCARRNGAFDSSTIARCEGQASLRQRQELVHKVLNIADSRWSKF